MDKEQLVYKINKKEYLLIELPITCQRELESNVKEAEKFGGFMQGIKDINTRLFGGNAILKLLIPTDKVKEFIKLTTQ